MTRLHCPHCGRVGQTTKTVAPDAKVRCPGCQQTFRPSASSSTETEGRGLTIDVTPASKTAVMPTRPAPAPAPAVRHAAPSVSAAAAILPYELPPLTVRPTPAAEAQVPAGQVDCGYCGESILSTAKKCKHCGEFLDPVLRDLERLKSQPQAVAAAAPAQPIIIHNTNVVGGAVATRRWSRGTAALMSLLFPGLGQLYKGQPLNAMVWMACTLIGYVCYIVPGLFLHACCVAGAASGDPYR